MIGQEALLVALRRMQVETGSLVCLGCGYEHNCSIHGCAILREAVKALEAPEPAAGESLTVEQLQAVPHGKVKDNTLNDICKRANEIAMQRVLTVPETNADRIRAMSDEELAAWLEYPICKYSKCTEECPVFPQNKDKSCKENILNYLRQPPEEKGGLPF